MSAPASSRLFPPPAARALGLPLVPVPRPFRAAFEACATQALAADLSPDDTWAAFLGHRRRHASRAYRATAVIDDWFRTDEPEYLDRDDTSPAYRRHLLERLDTFHRRSGTYQMLQRLLVPPLLDLHRPKVLEIAGGHGQLAILLERALVEIGREPQVLGSDLMPELVALAEENARSAGSGATFRVLDARRLDLPDDSVDLAVNAFAMHHLPFGLLVEALRELRRVARRAVIVDIARSPLVHPPGGLIVGALTGSRGCVHDGLLSIRKAWSVEAWHLAVALSGWERATLGYAWPASTVLHLEAAGEA